MSPTSSSPERPDPDEDAALAMPRSPEAIRSDEGPGISDTDDEASRRRAGEAGREAFDRAAGDQAR